MIFNWLLIAGLPIDPAPDVATASAAAAACCVKWAGRANDQRKGPYYRTLLDQTDALKRALSDKEEIDRLAEQARTIAFPAIDAALLAAAGATRTVSSAKIEAAARVAAKGVERKTGIKDVTFSADLVRRRAASLGVSVKDDAEADRAERAYERFAKPDPAHDAAFKVDAQLSLYGAADLYEFACPPGCADPRSAVGDELVRRAEELAGSFKQDKERKSTIETLAQKAKEVFGNRERRRLYDAYLQRHAAAAALDELKDFATLSGGVVDGQLAQRTESALRRVLGADADEAPYLIEGFCRAQRPPLALRREEGRTAPASVGAGAASRAGGGARTSSSGGSGSGADAPAASSKRSKTGSASASAAKPASPRSAPSSRPIPTRCDPVSVEDVSIVNGDLVVRILAPSAATGFVVLTRPDRFARSLSDTHPAGLQTRHEVPRALFERDGALVIPDARKLGCYVTVYAEYRAEGKVRYSKGCEWQVVSKRAGSIAYRVDARRLPLRAPRVRVTFCPKGGPVQLPEALIVYAKGSLPLAAEGARVAARVPAQQITRPLSVELDGLPNERNLYVRVFAASGDAEAFALEPGSYCKVS